MAFPHDQINPTVEIALGADLLASPDTWVWTDISEFVRIESGINIVHGRADEDSSASPSSLSFTVDNRDGRFCRLNPHSPYYGGLTLSTPIQVFVSPEPDVRHRRFSGFISEFPNTWGSALRDSKVAMTANGVLRRLEAASNAASPLRGRILSTSPVAYWPLEDLAGSTEGASAIPGVKPMTRFWVESYNSTLNQINFGEIDGPPGSYPTPETLPGFVGLNGYPPRRTSTSWTVFAAIYASQEDDEAKSIDPLAVLQEDTDSFARVHLELNGNQVNAYAYTNTWSVLGGDGAVQEEPYLPFDGQWHYAFITATQSGNNINFTFKWDDKAPYTFSANNQTLSPIQSIQAPSYVIYDIDIRRSTAHVAHWDRVLSSNEMNAILTAAKGHHGELAETRMARVCEQEGIMFIANTGDDVTEPCGTQPLSRLVDILHDCENVDGGVLFEHTFFDLHYNSRSWYLDKAADPNSVDLELTRLQFDPDLQHQDDDRSIGNDWTISREGGASARMSDEDHVRRNGRYDKSETINLASDDRPIDYAGWYLHNGTKDAYRYPMVNLNLARDPELIQPWVASGVGGRIRISDPPPGLPPEPIDIFVEGYTETFYPKEWHVSINASSVSRWKAARLDSETLGRLDTDGSTLVDDVASGDTTLRVLSQGGPEWITSAEYADDFPFDIGIAGEQMTVTAVASGMADSFDRTVSNGWGTSSTGHVWTTVDGNTSDYETDGLVGKMLHPTRNIRHFAVLDQELADVDVSVDVNLGFVPTVGSIATAVMARWQDSSNFYMLHCPFNIDGTLTLELYNRVSGSFGLLQRNSAYLPVTTGVPIRLRLQCRGGMIKAKAWSTDGPEPFGWAVGGYDETFSSGLVGAQSVVMSNNTNALPVAVEFDNFEVRNIQDFEVTRSINTVVKSHNAGSSVGLYTPVALSI